ncbi:hypothetical protein [Thiolapillus sp.]|uniref:hypothetical protein n=1 Tax=Thiolapillus sp. TaxID=2017437 RepID=UPI0025CFD643|nr:hypothetical protein [Thiolapillus sp.]
MDELAQKINDLKENWETVRDKVITYQAQWQNTLPENTPAMIDATLSTLVGLVSRVSDTSRKGRAMRLAEVVATTHLVNAHAVLNNHLRSNQFNQFPTFCNHVAQAASAMYGVYVLASQDGQDTIKEACLQINGEMKEVSLLHENLTTIEENANSLSKQLSDSVTKAGEHTESCEAFDERAAEHLAEIQGYCEEAQTAVTDAKDHEQSITELAEQAVTLEQDISTRLGDAQKATQKLDELSERAKEVREELESLLPGATAAGLAQAYRKTKKQIEERMAKQFKLFGWGLAGLVGTLILGHFLLPPLPTEPGPLMIQLFSRAMLASPAVWFTWVVVRQYTYLSRLHTDYGFKEAVATSFEGFRRMMEELDEADNKNLTSALSIKAIDIIGSDPDRLGTRHHGDDSPWSHVLKTLTSRLFGGKGSGE